MGKLAAACVVLMLACGLMSGCSFFERQGQVAAQETQPSRERVSDDTQTARQAASAEGGPA